MIKIKTEQEALAWMKKNKELIRTTTIGKQAGIDVSDMSKIMLGKSLVNGSAVKLDEKKLSKLVEVINRIRE